MTKKHRKLVEAALEAIEEVFTDTTVSQRDTLASLSELTTELEIKRNAIESDLRRTDG